MKKILSVFLALSLLLTLSVPAFAAGDSIKVTVNNNQSYTVNGIIETKNYQINIAPTNRYRKFPKESKVYTVATGTEISIDGLGSWGVDALQLKDGKLVEKANIDWSKTLSVPEELVEALRYPKGSSIKFLAEGYFIFVAADFSPMELPYEEYAVVLNVVKSGTNAEKGKADATVTEKTPTTNTQKPATPNTPAPSKSADKNTVKVAGENRTLGQVQTYSSGGYIYTVSNGDTLYDIAKRFYGDGNLWKELQKINQKNLNETKDGIIFAGFNLIIPAELDGVRANIG